MLHYQPQVDLRSGKTAAIEALVRWPHPRLGLIPPLDFLPLAEEAGLMGPLTRLVLERALEQCACVAGGRGAARGLRQHLVVESARPRVHRSCSQARCAGIRVPASA